MNKYVFRYRIKKYKTEYYVKQLWFKFLCFLGLRTERRIYFNRKTRPIIVGKSINEIKDFIDNIDDIEEDN